MSALTEDDVRRIIREELDRVRVMPVHTTPQPAWPYPTTAPYGPQPPTFTWPDSTWLRSCPNGCKPGAICGNANCPLRVQIT